MSVGNRALSDGEPKVGYISRLSGRKGRKREVDDVGEIAIEPGYNRLLISTGNYPLGLQIGIEHRKVKLMLESIVVEDG